VQVELLLTTLEAVVAVLPCLAETLQLLAVAEAEVSRALYTALLQHTHMPLVLLALQVLQVSADQQAVLVVQA
jgi:hypothetical protein